MALLASDILNTVSQILFDETNTRWSAANLLTYLNEAQRQLVSYSPRAGTETVIAKLDSATGVTQSLPTTGRAFVDITRNLESVVISPGGVPGPGTTPSPGLLVAESDGATGVTIYYVSTTTIITLCSIAYTAAHAASPIWLKFDAVPLGTGWLCVLAGDGTTYGGDLFSITNAGVATNITSALGVTWSSALKGPTGIVASTSGAAVTTNETGFEYLFSADAVTWVGPTTITESPNTNGYVMAGASTKTYVTSGSSAFLDVSTDGVNFTATTIGEMFPVSLTVTGDGGVLAFDGSSSFSWLSDAGVRDGSWIWPAVTYGEIAMGNAYKDFGYTPMWGAYKTSDFNFLVRDTGTGQCSVVRASSMATLVAGTAPATTVGGVSSYGYGCYDLGSGNYVTVLSTGIYRTADFQAFTLARSPGAGESFIGAGGWIPSAITTPVGWA